MGAKLFQFQAYFAILGLLCGVTGFRLGWRIARNWALPVLQGGMGFLAFAVSWRSGGALPALMAVIGWTLGSTIAALMLFLRQPGQVDSRVLRAAPYKREMLEWLESDRGFESRTAATVARHLYELAGYLLAAAISANLLSLILGALLLNYMNAYVAMLLAAARRRWTVVLLAWNVWSVVRVLSYLALGVVAATPLATFLGYPESVRVVRALWILGSVGVVLDLLLKLTLSRTCGRRLRRALDWERLNA